MDDKLFTDLIKFFAWTTGILLASLTLTIFLK